MIGYQKLKPDTELSLVTLEGGKINCALTILKKEWSSKLKTKDRVVHLKPDNSYNSTAPDAALVDSFASPQWSRTPSAGRFFDKTGYIDAMKPGDK